jgi:hypothetical protein
VTFFIAKGKNLEISAVPQNSCKFVCVTFPIVNFYLGLQARQLHSHPNERIFEVCRASRLAHKVFYLIGFGQRQESIYKDYSLA